MFSILKIGVSGFKMLKDNFEINFIPEARVNEFDLDGEAFEVAKNLYAFNIIAFTGKNSSGKSTTLGLINKVLRLMKSGRWTYVSNDFKDSEIKLHLEFFVNGTIYLYNSIIRKKDEGVLEIASPYCQIHNEELKFALYDQSAGKKYKSKLNFQTDINTSTGIDDTSKLVFICGNYFYGYNIDPFVNQGFRVTENFFRALNLFKSGLTLSIIRLLDDSIEKIEYDNTNTVLFKRFDQESIYLNKVELLNVLSNGTIKGIELYLRVALLLKTGGILVIDEIENCFHKNLVNNILFLLKDKTINRKNSQLIFSTHYVEILDVFDRRDNIFVLHKNNNEILISNVYNDYGLRTEILKSKQFNNNAFGTLLNYDLLMEVKEKIRDEILNND